MNAYPSATCPVCGGRRLLGYPCACTNPPSAGSSGEPSTGCPFPADPTTGPTLLGGDITSSATSRLGTSSNALAATTPAGVSQPQDVADLDGDVTGFASAPRRYMTTGREAIDIIREDLGDAGFVAYCRGAARKYELRAGHKGPADVDARKAEWYRAMVLHLEGQGPDPRAYRGGR